MSVALILANRKNVNLRKYRLPLGLIEAFVIWQIIILFASDGNIYQQIFGSQGRHTGFVTYLGFSFVFIGAMIASKNVFHNQILNAVFVSGTASIFYGLIQAAGLDPIKWINPYSPVFGFLGNPNFQSSLLGVLGSIAFAQFFVKGLKIHIKLFIGAYFLLSLYIIKETASQQGFLVLGIGSGVVLGLYVAQRGKTLGICYAVLSAVSFIAVLLGILNKGPLASILYKASVTYRGDYWRAGWKMTSDHPIFGVGMDSYGDWYRRSRDSAATLRRGPEVTSNAAHNVYLDISSYGGFPLLIIYVGLMVLVVISAVKVLRRDTNFNPIFVGLVGGWVAFQAQSIISINQIGLAIWGWVLSGLIIGFEINTRDSEVVDPVAKKSRTISRQPQSSAGSVVALFVAFVLGVLVGMPPYLAAAKYKSALEANTPQSVQKAAYIWPYEPSRMIEVAMILDENKLAAQALEVTIDAVGKFPDNFGVWATLQRMTGATAEQKAEALAQMKRLDPLNTNLK